ncbi:hypothetical protein SAMD00019534_113120 [Acytostelium subglobosum LB1]|uniref:hypothetical protein n=1 Tax=Acytostelium subglobosum LB1 TaxID=1410327 RepID=UPI000644849C|nr:hypothetical protein SAMD00019534_113120 [Acytostelium subglobosum LB1]GAM28136.1 hypothetical protein SAMD00019534_113120 [Acytostelium subglobosum LB1]|eukprot:XP_012748770.1 hypothetical protein SAMD00019534_113120 [Acytostelium subglobosum LB1]
MNAITSSSGNLDMDNCSVRVALRVRPLSSKELTERSEEVIKYVDRVPQVIVGKDQTFTFDSVFGGRSRQVQVYDECVVPLVDSIFQGYNSTILAYGQTGSGKTYTMGSTSTVGVAPDELGVIPRVIGAVFDRVEKLKSTHSIVLKVSFLELYNEEIRDMLNPDAEPGGLAIRETPNGEVHIPGLFEEVVRSRSQMEDALIRGSMSRTTGSTLMNVHSSRSHAIFTIIAEQTIVDADNEENNISEERNPTIRSKFHFVDLAGSERIKKTKAEGQRLKEGININSGLLALGNVISALGDTRRANKAKHVPYRDSKLTRMLQSSLGGNSRTLMIACVSPADSNFEETLNTLKYAYRARNIMNKPVVNVDPLTKQINMYKGQIQLLKDVLISKCNYKESDLDIILQDVVVDLSSPMAPNKTLQHHQQQQQQQPQQHQQPLAKLSTDGKEPPLTPSKISQNQQFEDSMKISQLEFENNMLQEISNKVTSKYKVLLVKYKQLEDTSYNFINNFSPNRESNDYLDMFNQFQSILNPTIESTASTDTTTDGGSVVASASGGDTSDEEIESIENVTELIDENERLSLMNQHIVEKEEELERYSKTQAQYHQIKEMYDSRLKELEVQLFEMKEEHDNVMRTLEERQKDKQKDGTAAAATGTTYDDEKARLTAHYEKKLAELKHQLDQHTKSKKDHQRLMELKTKSDEKIDDLTSEIKDMKRQKSDMLKRMRDELKKRDDVKQNQAKEMEALKKEARKSEQLIGQLKNQSKKKDQLLQKKIDESEAIKKKLKEIEFNKLKTNSVAAPVRGGRQIVANGSSNNSGFRPKAVQAAAPTAAATSTTTHQHPSQFSVPNWREWLLLQIGKNLSKNEMTETLDRYLSEKDLFVRESTRLKQQYGNGGNKMTKSEYQEQSAFLEMNIKQQNEKISRVQKDLASFSIDYMDSTEIMRKVSTTPYEKLPHLIQASFELCVEYAEQTRAKRDQFDQRTTSSSLQEGIKQARSDPIFTLHDAHKQTSSTSSPVIESLKDTNHVTIGSKLKDHQQQQKQTTSTTTTTTTTTTSTKQSPIPSAKVNNIHPSSSSSSSSYNTGSPFSSPPVSTGTSSATKDFLQEIELLQQQIRQSSLNFKPLGDDQSTLQTSPPPISLAQQQQSPTITAEQQHSPTISISAPSVESKVNQILDDLKQSKERSKNRQKMRKNKNSATSSTQPDPTDQSINSGFSPSPVSTMIDHSEFDNSLLDVDMDPKKLTSSPKSRKQPSMTTSGESLSPQSPQSDGDVFSRLSAPRPDSRLRLYRDKLKGDTYRTAILSTRRQDLGDGNDNFIRANWSFTGHDGAVLGLVYDEQSNRLFSSGQDKVVKAWDLVSGDCVSDLTGHTAAIKALALHTTSGLLFSGGGSDRFVKVWDIRSGNNGAVQQIKVQNELLCMASYGNFVFGGLENSTVKVWDVRSLRSLKTPLSKNQSGSILSLSYTSRYLVTGSRDHTVTLYNKDSLEVVQKLQPNHLDGVNALCTSATNEDIIYSGSRDRTIKRWEPPVALTAANVATPNYQQNKLGVTTQHQDWVTSLASHSGLIFSGCRDSTIKGWDPQLNNNSHHLIGHESSVNCLVSTRDVILSGSADRSIKLWNVL